MPRALAVPPCLRPYAPLNVLKPVAPDVWLADGPEVRMAYLGLKVPFSTRMTVARLEGGALWVHSPTAPDPGLLQAVAGLGRVAWLVAPNTLHHSWMGAWAGAFPGAEVHAAPGLEPILAPQVGRAVHRLGPEPPAAWAGTFDQVLVPGGLLTEVDFLHRPSRTLILTDLIENFEAERVCRRWRWIMRFSGCCDPNGSAPYDMRLSFWRHRAELRAAARRMVAWRPERVILAHGRWYDRDGAAQVERAFRWAVQ